jgi:lipoprotein-anchoring transpeptidase ErfK/SrfK
MLEGTMDVKARQALHGLFHEITDILFFSEYRNEFSIVHVIRKGDTIGGIAKQFGVTEELVCQWNAIEYAKRNTIRENQTLKIVANAPRIVVSKGQYTLSYYFGERLARQYIIAHGTGNGTPAGTATVKSKVVDPDKGPHAGPMQQEMDERWIGLTTIDDNGVPRDGIGIHGTKYEDSIPGETSHGCVRMFNRDVVELFDWVPRGMTVEIRQ